MRQIVVDIHLLASSCFRPHKTDFQDCWMDFLSSLIVEKKILLFTGQDVHNLSKDCSACIFSVKQSKRKVFGLHDDETYIFFLILFLITELVKSTAKISSPWISHHIPLSFTWVHRLSHCSVFAKPVILVFVILLLSSLVPLLYIYWYISVRLLVTFLCYTLAIPQGVSCSS